MWIEKGQITKIQNQKHKRKRMVFEESEKTRTIEKNSFLKIKLKNKINLPKSFFNIYKVVMIKYFS